MMYKNLDAVLVRFAARGLRFVVRGLRFTVRCSRFMVVVAVNEALDKMLLLLLSLYLLFFKKNVYNI